MKRLKDLICRINYLSSYFVLMALLMALISCERGSPVEKQDGSPVLVGAYYYPWYAGPGKEGNWNKANLRTRLIEPQMPVLSEYNSQDEAVIKQHLAWAQEAGINFFAMNWWGPNTLTDGTVRDYFAPYLVKTKSDFKYCIFYHTPGRLRVVANRVGGLEIPLNREAEQKLLNDFFYLAREHFPHPNYLKINNRPVVFLYLSRSLAGKVNETLRKFRTIVKNQTQWEIFLIGDEISWDEPDAQRIKALDAITAYNMAGPAKYHGLARDTGFFIDLDLSFKKYNEVTAGANIKMVPNVLPGFNDRGVKPDKNHPILPREISEELKNQGSFYRQYFQIASKYLDPEIKMIIITSWNEWHEDTQIEPVISTYTSIKYPQGLTGGYDYYAYGDLYLKITKEEISKLTKKLK